MHGRSWTYHHLPQIAQIAQIPEELETVKVHLRPDDYTDCRALVTGILTYWVGIFPQMAEGLEEFGSLEPEVQGDNEEGQGEGEGSEPE